MAVTSSRRVREDFVIITEDLTQFRMKKLFLIIIFYLISDPCCSGTKTVTGYLGQTLTISCYYPVEFETNPKAFYRLDAVAGSHLIQSSGTQQDQDGRFSISDDRRNKVFSVNITDVREDDVGVYSCAVFNEDRIIEETVSYYSLFTVIQLQATAGSTIITITTVCVCVTLLLMGGFVLIYKLRQKNTQDSASISQRTEANNTIQFKYLSSEEFNSITSVQRIRFNTRVREDFVIITEDLTQFRMKKLFLIIIFYLISDPCCSGTKTVTGYLGQTLTISCYYPVEFETNPKAFYRLDAVAGSHLIQSSGTQQDQDGRFSISDDRRNKVFSVNITDVREDDVGVYSCAVFNEDQMIEETAVSYYSLFTRGIQLQATGSLDRNVLESLSEVSI
ncbi:hypothetical protein QTP86_011078 [Hemibagrus guttatus]|nr:hypothetical protein QTP86_011078 [Hemibagrus guttatus]